MTSTEPTGDQALDIASSSQYQRLPTMTPYGQIPSPNKDAKESAERHYLEIVRTNPELAAEFDTALMAWKALWHSKHWDTWVNSDQESR